MFQGSEIFVILLVALVVLGPERLPVVARKLGQYTAELRKAARDLRSGLESELGDIGGIADDLRSPINEMKQMARETTSEVKRFGAEAKKDLDEVTGEARGPSSWVGPKPISGPTPEDAMADYEAIHGTGESFGDAVVEADDVVGKETSRGLNKSGAEAENDSQEVAGEARSASSWVGPRPLSGLTPEATTADHESSQKAGNPIDETVEGEVHHLPGEATG